MVEHQIMMAKQKINKDLRYYQIIHVIIATSLGFVQIMEKN
jgi:hypothetical protein